MKKSLTGDDIKFSKGMWKFEGSVAKNFDKHVSKSVPLYKEGHEIKMFMQVHDELVFELESIMADEYAKNLKMLMSNALKLSIPLEVDVGIGSNWQEAH